MKPCPQCGKKRLEDDAPNCPQCGYSFRVTRECYRCGRQVEHILGTVYAGYCPQCRAKGESNPDPAGDDGSGIAQAIRWGSILVLLGVGSLVLPLCGFQFRLMTLLQMPLGEYWWVLGVIAMLVGIVMLAIGYRSYMKKRYPSQGK